MGVVSQRKEYKKLKKDSAHIKTKKKGYSDSRGLKFAKKDGTVIAWHFKGIKASKNTLGGTQVGIR